MRRWLITFLAILVIILFILPFLVGRVVKYELMHTPAKIPADQGLTLRITDYQEGWFSSHLTVTVQRMIPGFSAPLIETAKLTVYHGPFLLIRPLDHHQWFGQASFVGQAQWQSAPPVEAPQLKGLMVPVQLSGMITLWGKTLYLQTTTQELTYQASSGGFHLSVASTSGSLAWALSGAEFSGEMIFNDIEATDGVSVDLPTVVILWNRQNQDGYWLGKTTVLLPALAAQVPGQSTPALSLSGGKFFLQSELTGDHLLNASLGIQLQDLSISGTSLLSQLSFLGAVTHLNLNSLQNLKTMTTNSKQAPALSSVEPNLAGVQVKLARFSAITPYGLIRSKGFIALPATASSPQAFSENIQGRFMLMLPKTALDVAMKANVPAVLTGPGPALPPGSAPAPAPLNISQQFLAATSAALLNAYEQGVFVAKSDQLVSVLAYHQGKLYLNGKVWQPTPPPAAPPAPTPPAPGVMPHAS